jgi:hypothetical protein
MARFWRVLLSTSVHVLQCEHEINVIRPAGRRSRRETEHVKRLKTGRVHRYERSSTPHYFRPSTMVVML